MKTSSKLLIALLLCIPLAMVAYGYLLKKQFDAGNFVQDIYPDQANYVFKSLAPFKHVKMDGSLYVLNESNLTNKSNNQTDESESVSIQLNNFIDFVGWTNKRGYSVLKGYESAIKTRISNDTLYLSLFKLNGKPISGVYGNRPFLTILNKDFKSIDITSGYYNINHISGEDLQVKIKEANLHLSELKLKKLTLIADRTEPLGIDASVVDTFQYAFSGRTNFTFGTNKIKAIENLGTDSLSIISVRGYAPWMEQFLPALTHSSK